MHNGISQNKGRREERAESRDSERYIERERGETEIEVERLRDR